MLLELFFGFIDVFFTCMKTVPIVYVPMMTGISLGLFLCVMNGVKCVLRTARKAKKKKEPKNS